MNTFAIRTVAGAILGIGVLLAPGIVAAEAPAAVTIKVVYDNYVSDSACRPDWGFACVITGPEKTILFDTGGKGDLLLANLKRMNVCPADIRLAVISHEHGDHTGGLLPFLRENRDVSVFLPAKTPEGLARGAGALANKITVVGEPVRLCEGAFILGPMRSEVTVEQALVLETAKGLVIVTGCAHPGVVAIARRAREEFHRDIHMILGGLHLLRHSDGQMREVVDALKRLGVQKVAPSHCTGDRAIALFRDAFGDGFERIGAGRVLVVGGEVSRAESVPLPLSRGRALAPP